MVRCPKDITHPIILACCTLILHLLPLSTSILYLHHTLTCMPYACMSLRKCWSEFLTQVTDTPHRSQRGVCGANASCHISSIKTVLVMTITSLYFNMNKTCSILLSLSYTFYLMCNVHKTYNHIKLLILTHDIFTHCIYMKIIKTNLLDLPSKYLYSLLHLSNCLLSDAHSHISCTMLCS